MKILKKKKYMKCIFADNVSFHLKNYMKKYLKKFKEPLAKISYGPL